METVITNPGAAAAPATSEFGRLLSPSQVSCFTDCSARWWFKYGVRLPDPKNSNLAFGIATHEAIATHLRYKAAGVALEPADVAQEFSAHWANQLAGDTILRDDDDPRELDAKGRVLVSRWAAEVAPGVDPVAIEEKVEGVIAGVRVQGKVDVRERSGRIRDIKTAARKPNGVSAQHAFQLATYVQISPAAAPVAVVDTLVKTKEPQLLSHEHLVDGCAIDSTRRMYPLVQAAMRNEIYVPNRASSLCSRKNCSFWRACTAEFGGRVAE